MAEPAQPNPSVASVGGNPKPVNANSRVERDIQNDPMSALELLSELSSKFLNFDDATTYRGLVDQALSQNTANFAVRFGLDQSEIAINLKPRDLQTLLAVQAKKEDDNVTWM